MDQFRLEIITPGRRVFDEDVELLSVPTSNGHIGILPHHIPLFTTLTEGELKITTKNKELFLAIGGGFMEVTKEKVSVLVSRAYHAHELNEAEIKKAQQKARDVIANKGKGDELAEAQSILRRSFIELKTLRRVKHRQEPTLRTP